jgi:hypothetical protein
MVPALSLRGSRLQVVVRFLLVVVLLMMLPTSAGFMASEQVVETEDRFPGTASTRMDLKVAPVAEEEIPVPEVDPDSEVMLILADGKVSLGLSIEGIIFYTVEIEGEECDEDDAEDDECMLKFKIGALNKSDQDYKMAATIMLLGGGGKVLASQKETKSIEEDEEESLKFKFELTAKKHARVKKCRIRFAVMED